MIDKVTNVKQDEFVTGYKLITNNEWFINDSHKHMPHMLIVDLLSLVHLYIQVILKD